MTQETENVTVIIATENNAKTIKRALESATGGSRPANKVIIGDNDSKDGTYDILCGLLGAESVTIEDKTGLPPQFKGELNGIPVIIFRKRPSTIGHTLNVAMQMDWQGVTVFGFMDGESWYSSDKIEKAIDVYSKHRDTACVVSDCDNHYPDVRVERIFRCSFDMQRLLSGYPYDRNFFVRPQSFQKLQSGFNEQMSIRDDYDLLVRISEIGLIYHIPESLHGNLIVAIDEETKQSISQCEKSVRQMAEQRRGNKRG